MKRIALAASACVLLAGCAEKSESQRVTDAVKTEVAQRGKALHIDCIETPLATAYGARASEVTAWSCVATLQHPRTPFANCPALDFPGHAVEARCGFSRKRTGDPPELLVIK